MMPTDELTKRIKGDWFEIREGYDDIHTLEDVFGFSVEELSTIVSELRGSVENGVTEYKQRVLSSMFTYLESLQYDSKGFERLGERSKYISYLLYVVLIQRLIANGSIKIRTGEDHEAADEPSEQKMEIKDILREIQNRIAQDPSLKQDQAIKNIMMQIAKYRRELDNMKKLAPNILPEKQKAFYSNFKQTFEDIADKVREQYRTIQKRDEAEAAQEIPSTNPLKNGNLDSLEPVLTQQGKELSIVRSTLAFAARERYKTRDILTTITERKDRLNMLISSETSTYKTIDEDEHSLSRAFCNELITTLNRQITRMS